METIRVLEELLGHTRVRHVVGLVVNTALLEHFLDCVGVRHMKSDVTGADGGFRCVNGWVTGSDNQVYLNAVIEQPSAIKPEVGPPDRPEPEYVAIKRLACLQVLRNEGDVVERLNGQGSFIAGDVCRGTIRESSWVTACHQEIDFQPPRSLAEGERVRPSIFRNLVCLNVFENRGSGTTFDKIQYFH